MKFSGELTDKKILLHACCGPCSLGAIEPLLQEGAKLSVLFYNPCIVPVEYDYRLSALSAVCEHYGLPLIAIPCGYAEFSRYADKYRDAPEGGARCNLCFSDRLHFSADYALFHGFDGYTTSLTVSPHKNAKLIFSIANEYAGGAPFVERDFKKRDGFLRSTTLSKQLGIYRQKFCGCEYSRIAAGAEIGGGL